MVMVMVNRLALAAVLIATAIPAAGQGVEKPAGRVTSFACVALPSPLNISVETPDAAAQTDRLRRVLVKSLGTRQAVVSPGAPLKLSLYVGLVRGPEIGEGSELDLIDSDDESDENIQIRVDLWSNRRNSVIGGRRDLNPTVDVEKLRIEITLDSRANGRCVWQGNAEYRLDGRDETATAEKMIPLLIERLGRSAKAEPITLE